MWVLGRYFPTAVFLSDALNHASMVRGMLHAGVERQVFPHNDVDAVARALSARCRRAAPP